MKMVGPPNEDCTLDSCAPFDATCDEETRRCAIMVGPDEACTQDSCLPNFGPCIELPGSIEISGGPVAIGTSPVISADLFVVVGTDDGRLCARTLNDLTPGYDLSPPTPLWASGCVALGDRPTRSSPAIGKNGVIYVTTDAGLYIIK
jgi:hypothetical protein